MPPHYSTGNPVHDMQSVLFDSGCIPIDQPDDVSWAMPTARAATPSGLSRFASSCQHRIAIACVTLCVVCLVYFAFELGRGVL